MDGLVRILNKLWFIWDILIITIEIVCFLCISCFKLNTKTRFVKIYAIVYYIFMLLVYISYHNVLENYVPFICFIVLTQLIFNYFFFKEEFQIKIFWVLFPFVIFVSIDCFILSIFKYIGENSDILLQTKQFLCEEIMICRALLCIVILILIFNQNYLKYDFVIASLMPVSMCMLFMGLPTLQIYVVIFLIFCVINYFILMIVIANVKNKRILEQREKLQGILMQLDDLKNLQESHEKLLCFKHDMNNHLQVVWGLAKLYQATPIEQYVQKFVQDIQGDCSVPHTGNEVIDVVLTNKRNLAAKYGIEIQENIKISNDILVNPKDLTTILVNGLDNAIEAINRIPDEEIQLKMIELSIQDKKNVIDIEIANPTDGKEIRDKDDNLVTVKEESGHGRGLTIIQSLVKEYKGVMSIVHEDYYFVLTIELPNHAEI